ncbi:hypothetical protein EJB05_09260, partial [Eragrostis curvula]
MSSMPPLLTPAGVQSSSAGAQPTRAASGVVAKPARGFQVFRIDGYSWTKTLPGGECISSEPFCVGGRNWQVDYYPNGADASRTDSDAVAVYLRLHSSNAYAHNSYNYRTAAERVRAHLLDLAGTAAYELPAETGVFTPLTTPGHHIKAAAADPETAAPGLGCGNAMFIAKEELERRRQSLLAEDCLAIRCDVGVMMVETVAVGPKQKGHGGRGRNNYTTYDDGDDSDGEDGGRRQQPQDDKEFIRRSRCRTGTAHCVEGTQQRQPSAKHAFIQSSLTST